MEKAVGVMEWSEIVVGMEAADAMCKVAEIQLYLATSICPGKFMVVIGGAVADVTTSIRHARDKFNYSVVDQIIIPNVHPDIFPALTGTTAVENIVAFGAIETYSVPSAIIAADAAAKAATVQLIEIRLARGLGGKSFVTLTGAVDAVRSAVEAGSAQAQDKGLLIASTVIPSLHSQLVKYML